MKTVWITALKEDQPRVAAVMAMLKRYGLECKGHFWADAPDKLAWRLAVNALQDARADLWLVLVDAAEINKPSVRYGLSLMTAALQSARGSAFPIMSLWNSAVPAEAALPQLMLDADLLEEASAAWPAKIVARVNTRRPSLKTEYRLDVLGDERLGQWFEIEPLDSAWPGVVFGVTGDGAEITFQAVGPKGMLPEKSVLEFAQEGMQLKWGTQNFTAWAVRNDIEPCFSYYARVKGLPDAVLFMPYSEGSDASADLVRLK